jgi:hypothetical protein
MSVILSGSEVATRLRYLESQLRSLRRQRTDIERYADGMTAEGQEADTITTAVNALLVDWAANLAQVITDLNSIPSVYRSVVKIGMPALYEYAVVDAADSANSGNGTIRVPSDRADQISPFACFNVGDVVSITGASNASNNVSRIVSADPEQAGADIITNGSFATDTLWTKGVGWTITGGAAVASGAISTALKSGTGGGTAMATAWTNGAYYLVTLDLTVSAGSLNIGTTGNAAQHSLTVAGTGKNYIVLANAHADGLVLTGVGFTGTVDNISIIPWTGLALDAPLGADTATDTGLVITLQER